MAKKLKKFLLYIGIAIFTILLGFFIVGSIVESPVFALRILAWGTSDTGDIARFHARTIDRGDSVFSLPSEPGTVPQYVTYIYNAEPKTENLQELILRTDTKAFVIIKDDKIMMQVYHDSEYQTPQTSFSVAKVFSSALIGTAIADGYIYSVDDLVIKYVPEIAGRGLDSLTIKNLLRMDTGIKYIPNDERPFYEHPFADDALTYYSTDLRKTALSVEASGTEIGESFRYNNYHPLLEGLILERATGIPVAEYLSERIWKPMGAEYAASWSIDSTHSGFEKMESGLNAAAVDFARFGLLYLHKGRLNGAQILPQEWVVESSTPDPSDNRLFETMSDYPSYGGFYGYHWWGLKNPDGSFDYAASGNLGQIIYIAPQENMVIVRFGNEKDSNVYWILVLQALVDQMSR